MMHELALQFQANGHETWVLTPNPKQEKRLKITSYEGINVIYFRSGEIKNIGKIKRAINESLLSFRAWHAAKHFFKVNKFDGIISYSPTIFWGLIVRRLRSKWKCASYLVLRDIFPQWTVDNGLMSNRSVIYWYFKFFEWYNYQSVDRIGVMSQSNIEYFRVKNKDISKFEILHNWADIKDIPIRSDKYRKELNLENKIVLFYGGNIGHAQNMIYLINLAKQFQNESNTHFLFVGNGDEVSLVLKEKEKHNLTNLTYLPAVNQQTYYEMLNEFDVGLFSLHPKHTTHNFPGKLLGYMAYSKPILGCVNHGNDLKDIVNNANAGIVIDSGDEDGLARAARLLIEDEKSRLAMGLNARKLLLQEFSVQGTCTHILNTLMR